MWMCVAFSGLAITIHTYKDIASISMHTEHTHMAVHMPEHATTLTSLNSCQAGDATLCIMCAMATMTMICEAM